jgi:hypothetical protein
MRNIAAIVMNGVVENVAVWSDALPSQVPDKLVVQLNDDENAGIGWTFNETDRFRPVKPFDSWIWDYETKGWSAPVSLPDLPEGEDAKPYEWDEETLSWIVPQWWIDEQAEQQDDEEA